MNSTTTAQGTRASILDTSIALFAAHGYEAVGVAALCEAAGVTKPTLYYHFGSKRGLLEAIVDERARPLIEAIRPLADRSEHDLRGDEIKLTLDRITETCWRFADDAPDAYRMILALYHAPPESEGGAVVKPLLVELHGLLTTLFLAAAPHHGAFRGREQVNAYTFLGMVHTWVALRLAGATTLTPPVRYRAVHAYLHGLFS